ncbi:hypothetical protein [Pedobacter suwonensis]|uniref:hypothetical protein n=1 Tax=Pedobacter suwonensis TaxID=332999 RepID=UPI0011A63A98|nr:hypothetical protein [Pedobacter suwonensis]
MKKSKARLAFEMLEKEMDLLLPIEEREYLGGTDSNGNTIWGIDSQGNFYYKQNSEDTWTAFQPLGVDISSSGNSGLNQMYSDYLYWKNQYSSSGYNSNGYNSNGYNSNGYNNTGGATFAGGGAGGGAIATVGVGGSSAISPFQSFLNGLWGTTQTSLISQYTSLIDSQWGDKAGLSTYTGVISGTTGSLITVNTTIDNGKFSSSDLTFSNYTISILAEGGFRFSSTLGASTNSVGLSLERGVLIGNSLSNGRNIAGFEFNNVPGGGEFVAALVIAGAIMTGGVGWTTTAPELIPIFSY